MNGESVRTASARRSDHARDPVEHRRERLPQAASRRGARSSPSRRAARRRPARAAARAPGRRRPRPPRTGSARARPSGRKSRSSRAIRNGQPAHRRRRRRVRATRGGGGAGTRGGRLGCRGFRSRARGGRAARRARRTCERGPRRAGSDSASGRPSARAASRACRPHEDLLELAVDALGSRDAPTESAASRSAAARAAARPRDTAAAPSAKALGSPGGTSSPFSPSRTTSATPPTAVPSTGVPTASASTTVCGKFSQAEVRTAASAARKSSSTSVRLRAPRKRTRSPSSSSVAARSSRSRSGPSPASTRVGAVDLRQRLEQDVERLLRVDPAGECEQRRREAELARAPRQPDAAPAAAGSRSGRLSPSPPRAPSPARARAGTRSGRRHARRGGGRGRVRGGAPRSAAHAPPGTRRASRRRAPAASPARRRRRRRASARAAAARACSRARRARSCWSHRRRRRERARRATRAATRACRSPTGVERRTAWIGKSGAAGATSAVVTTSTPWPRERRNAASSGAWLAGPPTSGGQIPLTTRTFTASTLPGPAALRACRRSAPDAGARPSGAAPSRRRSCSSGSARKRRSAAASAAGSPAGTSSPFSPSRTISGTPPTAVATTGRPNRERLDERVREVLPGRREHGCIGGAEEPQHLVAAERAEEPCALAEPELGRPPLERRSLRAVAGQEQRRAVELCERGRAPRPAPSPGPDDRRTREGAVDFELRPRLLPRRQLGQLRRGVLDDDDTIGLESPAERVLAQVRARADDERGTAERAVSKRPQRAHASTSGEALEAVEIAGEEPEAPSPLVGRVVGQLDDDGAAAPARARDPPRVSTELT